MKTNNILNFLMKMTRAAVILLISCCFNNIYSQKFEKLALTPPMGWNSWNKFACDINEDIIKSVADAMVASQSLIPTGNRDHFNKFENCITCGV